MFAGVHPSLPDLLETAWCLFGVVVVVVVPCVADWRRGRGVAAMVTNSGGDWYEALVSGAGRDN